MKTSKFAPKTPLEQLKQSKAEKLTNDKDKAARLMGRLRWKAELLMVSYFKALEILHACEQHNGHVESHKGLARQAESMFKIDFFEFYTFLERFITLCLATLGVSVSSSVPRENFNALRYITNPNLQRMRPQASHAYHANLLEALDDEKCPLHSSLGTQDARVQLGLAKDYRNAWKDADEKEGMTNEHTDNGSSPKNVKLPELGLEPMLRTLIAGCQHAADVVQAFGGADVDVNSLTSADYASASHAYGPVVTSDVPYEYMDDAMELD